MATLGKKADTVTVKKTETKAGAKQKAESEEAARLRARLEAASSEFNLLSNELDAAVMRRQQLELQLSIVPSKSKTGYNRLIYGGMPYRPKNAVQSTNRFRPQLPTSASYEGRVASEESGRMRAKVIRPILEKANRKVEELVIRTTQLQEEISELEEILAPEKPAKPKPLAKKKRKVRRKR